MKRIPFFKPGKHTSESGETIEFSAADVQQIVDSYDPKLHEAPLVIGHPKTNAPAYGLAQKLGVDENGVSYAVPHKVHPAFAEGVRDGRFSKRSASLYSPTSRNNPTPGKWYLRHIGFLGAHPPAIKGLPEVEFADSDADVMNFALGECDDAVDFADWGDQAVVRLLRGLKNLLLSSASFSKESVEEALPEWSLETATEGALNDPPADNSFSEPRKESPTMKTTEQELAEREAKLKADREAFEKDQADFAERNKQLSEKEQAARTAEIVSFCDALIADPAGPRLLPSHKAGMCAFMASLPDSQAVEFGEGAVKQSPLEFMQEFLKSLPPNVAFAEIGKGDDEVPHARHDFGESVDEASLEVWQQAKAIQKSQGITFAEALVQARNQE